MAVTAVVLMVSVVQMITTLSGRVPELSEPLLRLAEPFGIVNRYGLFAVMTTSRPEIIVQRSMDGQTWSDYRFPYKPGELSRAPGWAAPYQPRLDWQMWFAALGGYRNNPWFVNFMFRLLQGSPDVTKLLASAPGEKPPRYVRALLFEYSFTDWATRKKTGDWWQREPRGDYLPAISLDDIRESSRLLGGQNKEAAFHALIFDASPNDAGLPRRAVVMEADDLAGVQLTAGVRGAEAVPADVQQVAGKLLLHGLSQVHHHAALDGCSRLIPALLPAHARFRMHSSAAPLRAHRISVSG